VTDLQWRWTAQPLRIAGLHASVLAFGPFLMVTGLSRWAFVALALYVAFLWWCRRAGRTPLAMIASLDTRWIRRGRWPAF